MSTDLKFPNQVKFTLGYDYSHCDELIHLLIKVIFIWNCDWAGRRHGWSGRFRGQGLLHHQRQTHKTKLRYRLLQS